MTYLDLVQCDHSTAVDSFWLCHFWSSLVFHTFAQYLCDVKYFTFNIKARDRKAIPAVTIPQVQHHQGCELPNLRRYHCQLVVAGIEVCQLVLLEYPK